MPAYNIPFFIDNESFAALRGASDGAINFGVNVPRSCAEQARQLSSEFIEPSE